MVLLVGLNSRHRGKLERPIKPTTCAPADLEAAMDCAGKGTCLGDCRRIVEHGLGLIRPRRSSAADFFGSITDGRELRKQIQPSNRGL